MTRRRWIQIDGELVEVSPDYTPPSRDEAAQRGILWNDRNYQDMGDSRFQSRTQHREFMKSKGVTTADDFNGQWRSDEKRRIDAKHGIDSTRRADVERAIHDANSRRRK